MNIVIKKMETDLEIKGKAYVHWKSWREAYSGIVAQTYLDERTLAQCEEQARRSAKHTLIAKDEDHVVGFVQYGENHDGDLQNTGKIVALYVLADYYGRGIGDRLMQAAFCQLKMYPKIALWVLKDNERAVLFYKRYGFQFDGHQGATQIGATAVRMILKR